MLCALAISALAIAPAARASSDTPLARTPGGRPLVLTFDDEFRGPNNPSHLWRTRLGDDTYTGLAGRTLENNGELELYVDPQLADAHGPIGLNPFRSDGEHLNIVASPTPAALRARLDGQPYVSGVISSQPSFAQLYGYFEMRARLPPGKGLWPAFWLLPKDGSWPPEIDVMEAVSDPTHIYSSVHSTTQPGAGVEARVTPGAFHTFAVSWGKRRIEWFVDNRSIGSVPTPADMHKPMYVIANLAVGGDWPGSPDKTTAFPATLSIDFIRAYRFAND